MMEALKFEGSGAEYFKIWIVNILLTIVTFGLYYPWAKVRNNRYFYANSTLAGRNFEYHATGKQLFFGYLIGLVLFIIYTVVQSVTPVGGVIVLLIFLLALPWIIWRSLCFKLRMTSFSNVRFSFDGEVGGAYVNFMLLPLASFIALYAAPVLIAIMVSIFGQTISGLVLGAIGVILVVIFMGMALAMFAYMKKRNAHYKYDNYRYGQGRFLTQVEAKPFAIIILKTAALSILLYLGLTAVIGGFAILGLGLDQILALQNDVQDPEKMQESMSVFFMLLGPVYLGIILLSFAVIAYSYTRQRSYIFSNSTLDEKITFESTLKARQFAWVMITNFIVIICTFGLALPWAKVRMARLMLENTHVDTSIGYDDYITQKQKEQSSLGEQIGDAFDIDVNIGL